MVPTATMSGRPSRPRSRDCGMRCRAPCRLGHRAADRAWVCRATGSLLPYNRPGHPGACNVECVSGHRLQRRPCDRIRGTRDATCARRVGCRSRHHGRRRPPARPRQARRCVTDRHDTISATRARPVRMRTIMATEQQAGQHDEAAEKPLTDLLYASDRADPGERPARARPRVAADLPERPGARGRHPAGRADRDGRRRHRPGDPGRRGRARRDGPVPPAQGRDPATARRSWCSPAGRTTPGWPPGPGPTASSRTRSIPSGCRPPLADLLRRSSGAVASEPCLGVTDDGRHRSRGADLARPAVAA